jgi:hypothetical protein
MRRDIEESSIINLMGPPTQNRTALEPLELSLQEEVNLHQSTLMERRP